MSGDVTRKRRERRREHAEEAHLAETLRWVRTRHENRRAARNKQSLLGRLLKRLSW